MPIKNLRTGKRLKRSNWKKFVKRSSNGCLTKTCKRIEKVSSKGKTITTITRFYSNKKHPHLRNSKKSSSNYSDPIADEFENDPMWDVAWDAFCHFETYEEILEYYNNKNHGSPLKCNSAIKQSLSEKLESSFNWNSDYEDEQNPSKSLDFDSDSEDKQNPSKSLNFDSCFTPLSQYD